MKSVASVSALCAVSVMENEIRMELSRGTDEKVVYFWGSGQWGKGLTLGDTIADTEIILECRKQCMI